MNRPRGLLAGVDERSRGNLSSTPARRPLGLFMKGKVEDTSMAGLGVSFLDDDKSFSVIEATSFSIGKFFFRIVLIIVSLCKGHWGRRGILLPR